MIIYKASFSNNHTQIMLIIEIIHFSLVCLGYIKYIKIVFIFLISVKLSLIYISVTMTLYFETV